MFQDARDFQIVFLSLFLFLGILTRDWTLRSDLMAVVIFTCFLSQAFFVWFFNRHNPTNELDFTSLKSSLITSLSLCLLLRADTYLTMALAAILAIASKFLIQFQGKHFFNPANFGIVLMLIFRADAWVSPGQWGDDWWYGLLFLGVGFLVLKKVGRWDTSVAFLGCYSALEAIRNLWLGWTFDVYIHRLMSGSLLLFALFMITDPRSIPNHPKMRLIWATLIAGLTFILRNQFYVSTAVFWALFALAPLTIIFNYVMSDTDFNWELGIRKITTESIS